MPRPHFFVSQLLTWLREPGLSATPAAGRRAKAPESMTHADWVPHRAPVRHRDQSLSDQAVVWLRHLPEGARPELLCERFPRIANRLALLWRDPGLIAYCLDELIDPNRPDRQGFPAGINAELAALQQLNDERLLLVDEPGVSDER